MEARFEAKAQVQAQAEANESTHESLEEQEQEQEEEKEEYALKATPAPAQPRPRLLQIKLKYARHGAIRGERVRGTNTAPAVVRPHHGRDGEWLGKGEQLPDIIDALICDDAQALEWAEARQRSAARATRGGTAAVASSFRDHRERQLG